MVYGYDCPHRTSQLQNESTVHRVDGDLHVLDSSCKSFCTQVHHGKDFWQNLTRCPLLTSPNSLWASMTSFSQDTDLRCLLVAPSSPDLPPHDSTGHAYQTTTGTATKKNAWGRQGESDPCFPQATTVGRTRTCDLPGSHFSRTRVQCALKDSGCDSHYTTTAFSAEAKDICSI